MHSLCWERHTMSATFIVAESYNTTCSKEIRKFVTKPKVNITFKVTYCDQHLGFMYLRLNYISKQKHQLGKECPNQGACWDIAHSKYNNFVLKAHKKSGVLPKNLSELSLHGCVKFLFEQSGKMSGTIFTMTFSLTFSTKLVWFLKRASKLPFSLKINLRYGWGGEAPKHPQRCNSSCLDL